MALAIPSCTGTGTSTPDIAPDPLKFCGPHNPPCSVVRLVPIFFYPIRDRKPLFGHLRLGRPASTSEQVNTSLSHTTYRLNGMVDYAAGYVNLLSQSGHDAASIISMRTT